VIIDAHVHLIRPFDLQGKPQVYHPGPAGVEDYVFVMESSGIDRAFFISWSPEDLPADLEKKGIDVESVRETMTPDYALEVMKKFSDRFYWFPCHIGPEVPDHMAMARKHLQMGAAGLKLVLSFWGELPDDSRVIPFYDLVGEFNAQMIIDTSFRYLGKDQPADPDTLLQGHRETALRVKDYRDYLEHLRTIFKEYPTVNFQLAHAGARTLTDEHAREIGSFVREFSNVYVDLAGLPLEKPAFEVLVDAVGDDRVMFGTDWPHYAQGSEMTEGWIDQVRKPGRFSDETVAKILGENALEFVRHREPGLHNPEVM